MYSNRQTYARAAVKSLKSPVFNFYSKYDRFRLKFLKKILGYSKPGILTYLLLNLLLNSNIFHDAGAKLRRWLPPQLAVKSLVFYFYSKNEKFEF